MKPGSSRSPLLLTPYAEPRISAPGKEDEMPDMTFLDLARWEGSRLTT